MGKKLKSKPKGEFKKPKKQVNHEIVGLLIIALGLILAIAIYSDGKAILLQLIKDFIGGLFGAVIYAIPPIIVVYGILVMFEKAELALEKKFILLLVLFIFIGGVIHTYKYGKLYESMDKHQFNQISKQLYEMGKNKQGGGFLGGTISAWLVSLTGRYGSLVILGAFILVLVLILTKLSFVSFIKEANKILLWVFKILKETFLYIKDSVSWISDDEEIDNEEDPEIKASNSKDDSIQLKLNGKTVKVDKNKVDASDSLKNQSEASVQPSIEEIPEAQPAQIKINLAEEAETKKGPSKEAAKETSKEHEILNIQVSNDENITKNYKFPPVNLLIKPNKSEKPKEDKKSILDNATKLEQTLSSFGVEAKVVEINKGPTVTRYELQPSVGVKVSRIVNLSDDIALNLAASGIRIEAPIPGKAAVGIEVPNKEVDSVLLREMVDTDKFKDHSSKLAFAIGKDIGGEPIIADIAKMPHVLIAGATGSGKSVCINTLITSILYKAKPNEVKLLMIDPKVVELGIYNDIPHLLIPVVTDPKKAAGALNWAVQEMINRYKTFAEYGVRDIKGYNTLVKDTEKEFPQVVIIIDELADLMMAAPNDVEDAICRLAQMARAAGMHLVIATQRPSVDVITGVIKANIPSRISFAVTSQVDSRTILDMAGAEKLLGRGDMLFYPVGEAKPIRLQGAFISDKEVESIVEFVKNQGEADYSEDIIEKLSTEKQEEFDPGENDDLLPQAIEMVVESGHASISMLQRRLKVGYARAARLIDQMEARGVIGGFEGSKPRQVLMSKDQFYSDGFQA